MRKFQQYFLTQVLFTQLGWSFSAKFCRRFSHASFIHAVSFKLWRKVFSAFFHAGFSVEDRSPKIFVKVWFRSLFSRIENEFRPFAQFGSVWIQFLCVSKIWIFLFSAIFGGISHNGKGLCEVRTTATDISSVYRELAKTFSIC